jgi:two-component system LytT family response regulator
MTATRRVLIADDEAPARARVRDLLASRARYVVVAESDTGPSTLTMLRRTAPDLLFLDVQMPGMTGFEVMARLERHARPMTVFTTAYEQYALDAFEARAVDYLLKPYTDERFVDALERAELFLKGHRLDEWQRQLIALVETAPTEAMGEPLRRFAVHHRDRIHLVDATDVWWIEAARDYLCLHVGGEGTARHLVRMTMRDAEERLDRREFVRIHRSTIVRLDRIVALEPFSRAEDVAVLRDGTRLRVSRAYRDALRERLLGHRL